MNTALRTTLGLAVCVAMVVPGSASAADCYAGPAANASQDRPHLVDRNGDTSLGAWPGGDGAYDITKVWVTQQDDPPPGEAATFAVKLAVADLADHPAGAAFYVNYTAAEWVAAKALPDGTWRFSWGGHPANIPVVGAAHQDRGEVTGRVNTATDVISITLPAERLPGPRRDGREVRLELLSVSTGTALGVPTAGQPELLAYADTSTNAQACSVVLYPTRSE